MQTCQNKHKKFFPVERILRPPILKVNKTICLLRKLQLRLSSVTIYKSFVRPHLDYGDIIFGQAFNNSFYQRMESTWYNAALAITGTILGTSKERPYHQLGSESLQSRRCFRELSLFYKIMNNKASLHLFNLISKPSSTYSTHHWLD